MRLLAKLKLPLLILATLLVGLGAGASVRLRSAPANVAPTKQEAAPAVTVKNGLVVVHVDDAAQKRAGIESTALSGSMHGADELAYGSVLDIQALIDLRSRYAVAAANVAAAQSAITVSTHEFEQDQTLYQTTKSVSLRTVQAAQDVVAANRAKLKSAEAELQAVQNSAMQQYGPVLQKVVAGQDAPALQRLMAREDSVLLVTIPLGISTAAPAGMTVEAGKQTATARLISSAPHSDPTLEGRAYLYRVPISLATGSKAVAYLPSQAAKAATMLAIPDAAIVWYGGQPWAYAQIDDDQFERRPLGHYTARNGEYLVSEGFKADDQVVIQGAQLLLSEEQRTPAGQSGCKDPECDD